MFYSFNGIRPVVHASSFVHPQAVVTGDVQIGKNCYIGPGAALRGDWGTIILEDGCNVQENCTIHMFPGLTVLLKEGSHIGHGAIIHGATIGRNCLVGMNSVLMDHVQIGDESIVMDTIESVDFMGRVSKMYEAEFNVLFGEQC